MSRGDIWTVSGGPDYAGKPRPWVLIQDSRFDDIDSTTLCGLTTEDSDASYLRPVVYPDALNRLREVSYLMVDKITTVRRSKLGSFVGRLSDTDMLALNRALATFLCLTGVAASEDDDS